MSATAIRQRVVGEANTHSERADGLSQQFQVCPPGPKWSVLTLLSFRFVCIYFTLYIIPLLTGTFEYANVQRYDNLWKPIAGWAGKHLFGVTITAMPNGSGDTTFNYLQVFCFLVVAAVGCAVWSVLDRRRRNYEKLHRWLMFAVRVAVGSTMIFYGTMKVACYQMPPPSLTQLITPYGSSSPMGLLWTFIGASRGYSIFVGAVETVAGVLLFLPWCTTLGALTTAAAMTNVFLLNMCYDVPVKLFSFHLLLMAIFLAAPDLQGLAELFVLKRRVELAPDTPLFRRKGLNWGATALQIVFVMFFTVFCLHTFRLGAKEIYAHVGAPLYGVWSVDEFAVDGKTVPPLASEGSRWQRVVFDYAIAMQVLSMDGSRHPLRLDLCKGKSCFALSKRNDDSQWKAKFNYESPQPGILLLDGEMDGHHVTAKLQRVDDKNFHHLTRGFRWIQEYPYAP